jgi:hypothetical protein
VRSGPWALGGGQSATLAANSSSCAMDVAEGKYWPGTILLPGCWRFDQ